jgi:hypothetical protein
LPLVIRTGVQTTRAAALFGAAAAFACNGGPALQPPPPAPAPVAASSAPAGLELAEFSPEWLEAETDPGLSPAEAALHLVDHEADRLVPLALPADVRWLGFRALEAPDYRPRVLLESADERTPDALLPTSALEARDALVAVDGFAVPVSTGAGFGSGRFYLWPWPNGCCAGREPRLDELVVVQLPPGEVEAVAPLEPVRAIGRFEAGERLDLYGFAESLYRLNDARLVR